MRHLVTGAGSGIGRRLAERLDGRGDQLVLVGRDEQRCTDLAHDFPGAETVALDLADPAAVAAAGPGLSGLGSLDSVTHAAGLVDLGAVADLDPAAVADQIQVNLTAPIVLTGALLPGLRAALGTVVLINSGAGLFAHPTWSAYAASKQGLRAFADSLRAEEAANGVRVTSVFPGRVATPMQEKVHRQEGKDYDPADWIRVDTVVDAVLAAIDLPRDAVMPEVVLKPTPR